MDYPRFPISEMRLGKFPDSLEFQSWKVNFKTEMCLKTTVLHITVQWFKEVEIAKSIVELMISRSILERTDFPDYDMLDAMIASAMKKLVTSVHFRKRVSVEEQRAQKYDRFSRGRQTNLIYEHCPCTLEPMKQYKVSQICLNIRLQNDGVQDFDVRWDQALLSASETPNRNGPGGCIQVKIAFFCSASDCVGSVWTRTYSKQRTTELFQTEDRGDMLIKMMRTRNISQPWTKK